jgi:hypothetical protein
MLGPQEGLGKMKQPLRKVAVAAILMVIAVIASHAQRRPRPKPKPPPKPAETKKSRDLFLQVTVTGFSDIVTIQPHDEGVNNGGGHDRVNFKYTAAFLFKNVPLDGRFGPIAAQTTARAVWSVLLEPYGNDEGRKCQTKPGELKDARQVTGVLEKTSFLTLKITPGFRSQVSSPPCIGAALPEWFFIISIAPQHVPANFPGTVMIDLDDTVLQAPKKLVATGGRAPDYQLEYTIEPRDPKYEPRTTVLAHADITIESDFDLPPVPPLMDRPELF